MEVSSNQTPTDIFKVDGFHLEATPHFSSSGLDSILFSFAGPP